MPGAASRLSNTDLMFALLATFIWGMNFVPTKYALGDFTPLQLGAVRFFLAAFPLILFIPRPKIPINWLCIYALTQGVGQFGFLFFALNSGMSAALASVLMQIQIFFTALLGATLLGEHVSRQLIIGMAIAGVGLLCFVANIFSNAESSVITVAGLGLNLAAALMWSFSNIVVKKMQAAGMGYSPLSLIAWSSLISAGCFFVMSLFMDGEGVGWQWLDVPATVWLSVLYLGWAGNGVAYWLWTVLLTRYPANRVAPFSLGIPMVGVVAGIVLLDERVSLLQWTGSVLIISALVIVVFGSHRYFNRLMTRQNGV